MQMFLYISDTKQEILTNIYMFILHILWARKQLDFQKQYKTQLKKETFTL